MPEEPVKYSKESKKNIQYFTIEGATVISWKLPTEEDRHIEASANVAGGSGKYKTRKRSGWHTYIHDKDFGLMPESEWRKKVAAGISARTQTLVSPPSVKIELGTLEANLARCPHCKEPLIVVLDGTCSRCHQKVLRD